MRLSKNRSNALRKVSCRKTKPLLNTLFGNDALSPQEKFVSQGARQMMEQPGGNAKYRRPVQS